MLRKAQERLPDAEFIEGDIATYRFSQTPDLIFANASLHWLGDHETLFPRLLHTVRGGGVLALQMPDNLDEPSHRLMRVVAEEPAFKQQLENAPGKRGNLLTPGQYYDCLAEHAESVLVWRTTYLHALESPAAIADWFATTGLRPYLDGLDDRLRDAYLQRYNEALTEAYPRQRDGQVLLAMPRVFLVAKRSA